MATNGPEREGACSSPSPSGARLGARTVPPGANLVAVGLLLLMALAGYGFLLQRGRMPYSVHSDVIAEHLSTKTVLYDSLRQGRGVPFWRGDQFSGSAALTNPQALYTCPLHGLFWLMPPAAALGPTFWLHFVFAGLAGYLLGAALGLRFWPRMLMAACGTFAFKLIAATYAGWLPHLPGIVLAPCLLAAVVWLCRQPGLGSALSLALVGALALHSGHLQIVYYAAWLCIAYLLVHLIGQARRPVRWTERVRRLLPTVGWMSLAGGLAVGMATYLLLPLALEGEWITRGQTTFAFHQAGMAIEPRHLLTLLAPQALGSPLDGTYPGDELWEQVAYFGVVPLLLAPLGALLGFRNTDARFLLVAFFVTSILSMDTPVGRLAFELVPGYALFRLPNRLLFLSAMCATALAGIGLEHLFKRLGGRRRSPALKASSTLLLIALIGLEGGTYARRYLTTVPAEQAVPRSDVRALLAADPTLFRVAPLGRATLNYGWAAPWGLQMVTGYDAFNYRQYVQYFDLLQTGPSESGARVWLDLEAVARWDLLDQLNVKYLLARQPLEHPPGRLELVERFDAQPAFVFYRGMTRAPIYVYRNARSRPRVHWAGRIVRAGDEDEALKRVREHELNAYTVVQSERSPVDRPASTDRLHLTSWQPGRLVVELATQHPRLVIASEVWHPGWRARLDGQPVPVLRANLTLLGVQVPAGTHQLELEFQPRGWTAGLVVSLSAAAAFLGLAVLWLVRRTRR